ncbi:MAG TPA: protein phosphatase 2C domain-containing protein [Polyangiaceae bacterium]|nr:protein phosphatase 2C domain-containing protein [Polyangiaceae bacterium]
MQALGLGTSDVGQKRSQNEDRYVVDDQLGLYVVSDGMGGHAAGEVAAETAITAVVERVKAAQGELIGPNASTIDPARLVEIGRDAVEHACAEVHRLATSSSEYSGMGCTLTLLLVTGNRATLAHVGDTRLYLHRGGQTYQMTTDHTFSAELVRTGHLKLEDAKKHMYSNVLTRCIGSQPAVQVDTLGFEVFSGDRFLLCSDGLSEYVPDLQWLTNSLATEDLAEIPRRLIAFANQAGGHDNITAVVVQVDDPTPETPEPRRDSLYDNDALAGIFLFHSLPLAQLEHVRGAFKVRLCATGETLVSQGDPNATLWIVADGAVEVLKDDQTITVLGPGGHVGTATLLCRRAAGATLRVRAPSRVLALEGQVLMQLAHSHPWLGLALLEKLATWLSGSLAPGSASSQTLPAAAPDRWF